VGHVAKRATPRTDVAHDQERRRAVTETFAQVRAIGFFANREQPLLTQHLLELLDTWTGVHPCTNPRRFTQRLHRGLEFDAHPRHLVGTALVSRRIEPRWCRVVWFRFHAVSLRWATAT
jgi:hypothetical protein